MKKKEGVKMEEKNQEAFEQVCTDLIWDCHEDKTQQTSERCKKCIQNIGGEEVVCLKDVLW